MLSSTFISIILMLLESSLAMGVVVYFVYKKLKASRNETKTLAKILEDERSPKKFREKLKDYFEQEIKRTTKKHQELSDSDKDIAKRDLLLTRQNALNIEKRASQKNHLDQDYWQHVQLGYSHIIPEPEEDKEAITDAIEGVLPLSVNDIDGESSAPEIVLNKAASEELGRLRDAISNQYASIDELKRQLVSMKDDEDLAERPFMDELQRQISRLISEQEQMSICVKVLESENERLSSALQQRDRVDADHYSPVPDIENESEAIKRMREEQQQAEYLIRDLIRTNKEQLQCIATLESELEMNHDLEFKDNQTGIVMESLQKAKQEIGRLNQEKLENLHTIEQLQTQLRSLSGGAEDSAPSADQENKNLTKQLHAKTAELELLREEYQLMHQKFIKLSQDKAS